MESTRGNKGHVPEEYEDDLRLVSTDYEKA